jgi:YidC/Oxa1 family membrane protein insertase
MDRNSVLRWLLIAAAVILVWKFGLPLLTGSSDKTQALPEEAYANAPGFVSDVIDANAQPDTTPAAAGELCTIKGNRFEAALSTHGASLVHFWLDDPMYASGVEHFDLSTTPDIERWRSLRTLFRGSGADNQLKYDRFDWKLERLPNNGGCAFTYEDDTARIVKTVKPSGQPFELSVETQITNLTDVAKRHQYSITAFAYRLNKELKGSLGRQSPWATDLECAHDGKVERKTQSDKSDFQSHPFEVPGTDRYAAVNSTYFTQALVPDPGVFGSSSDLPTCAILAEDWFSAGQAHDADDAGHVFKAQLLYPPKDLAPKETAKYLDTAFFGPKERSVLAAAVGGRPHLGDVINLGFFTPVARVLVGVLIAFHDHVTFGNWGLAIILMTICLRTLLFPLTWKSIKTSVAMRRLKPEVDALNAKFADDAQAKNLAMMELWKKHGVNPLGGCLPQLVQMPVWFAMYTTLQTAVEMYHVKFLWFADLSAPDRLYILPLLLGAFMILQQRIVPQQGMDPMQQKMMMWMMPAIFTFMMLFLPAALGVYMLTNSMLGIAQQLIVEKIAPRSGPAPGSQASQAGAGTGKGKARV